MQRDLRNLPHGARKRLVEGFGPGVLSHRHAGFDADLAFGIAETRATAGRIELRQSEAGTPTIVGYATVYEASYDIFGGPPYGWTEIISKGAASKSVAERDDVYLFFDHDGLPLASTKDRSLTLVSDGTGLLSDATPDMRSPFNAEIVRRVDSGVLDSMSFAFRVMRQRWEDEDGNEADPMSAPVRRIQEVKLYDVSVVSFPANPATSVSVKTRGSGMSLADAKAALRGGRGMSLADAKSTLDALRV